MRVEVSEIENRNIYRVWYDGVVLIERTTSPMRAAARVLLNRGVLHLRRTRNGPTRKRSSGHAGDDQRCRRAG